MLYYSEIVCFVQKTVQARLWCTQYSTSPKPSTLTGVRVCFRSYWQCKQRVSPTIHVKRRSITDHTLLIVKENRVTRLKKPRTYSTSQLIYTEGSHVHWVLKQPDSSNKYIVRNKIKKRKTKENNNEKEAAELSANVYNSEVFENTLKH